MPEAKQDARPVSAALWPTKGLFLRAKEAGELDEILGGKDGDRLRSVCARGSFVRRNIAGAVSVGERFFDWEATGSKFGTMVGRLKPQAEIYKLIGGAAAKHGHAAEILLDCEEFRAAAEKVSK